MSLVFRENGKNRQNHGVFEDAVMGVKIFHSFFCGMEICKSQVSLTKKVSIMQNQEDINFQSERTIFFKSDGLIWRLL